MTHEMTRRCACGLLIGDLIGSVACAWPSKGASVALEKAAREHDLAILNVRAIRKITGNELYGNTVGGAEAGKIVLPEAERPCRLAVSPDGRWMAWDNWSALPPPAGMGAPLQVFITNAPQLVRSLRVKDGFGGFLAISSKAEHLALVNGNADSNSVTWRVIVLNVATVEIEHDVTDLITRFDLARVERLGISGAGNRLTIGFAERFVVIDLPSHKTLLEGRGRFPALSPDGESLAFTDDHKQLAVVSLSTGVRRTFLDGWWKTFGVGAWSPDGRYLLAGAMKKLSFSMRLVAVECATNRFADLLPLGELVGNDYVWAKRDLFSLATAK